MRSGEPGSLVGTLFDVSETTLLQSLREVQPLSAWRREALRTNLWLIPTVEVVLAAALFAGTYALDRAAYRGALTFPTWIYGGTADGSRQVLTGLAAAVITVVGLVFSITIVTLTLASTQFGPRMLRNFIRDRITQLTLGTFVATFAYAVLTLISISPGPHGDFVPHLSITISLALVAVDLAVLIVFIDHIAKSIQLPQVIASIAGDLSRAIEASYSEQRAVELRAGPSTSEMLRRIDESGDLVRARASGYLQFVRLDTLMGIAARTHAVIRLLHRPGHFVSEGQPLAVVWPSEAAPKVARALDRAHATGPHRTLAQDLSFAVDQLVEIAIRALSPAVNDTFTALTCIDWLGDSLGKVFAHWSPVTVHRDQRGNLLVITVAVSDRRLLERAFEKIRQASHGMPAVMIRQLEALARVMRSSSSDAQREVILEQAEMIMTASLVSVSEERDRADIRRRYDALIAIG
jgi:uncharacterized membrane protein